MTGNEHVYAVARAPTEEVIFVGESILIEDGFVLLTELGDQLLLET